jgi:protein translocase SecG subunit
MIEALHIAIALLVSLGILLQTRASGLSSTFGGSGAAFQVQRRGAEKLVYNATIWLSVVFFALAIVRWYL